MSFEDASSTTRLLLTFTVAVPFLSSCRRPHDSVQAAASTLTGELSNLVAASDGTPFSRHREAEIRQALKALSGKTSENLSGPMPVVAELSGCGETLPNAISIKIQWVDPKHEATGIFVNDSRGHHYEFKDVILWDQGPNTNAWTQRGFPANFDADTARAWENVAGLSPSVTLPWDSVRVGEPTIGLLTANGHPSSAIGLLVQIPAAFPTSKPADEIDPTQLTSIDGQIPGGFVEHRGVRDAFTIKAPSSWKEKPARQPLVAMFLQSDQPDVSVAVAVAVSPPNERLTTAMRSLPAQLAKRDGFKLIKSDYVLHGGQPWGRLVYDVAEDGKAFRLMQIYMIRAGKDYTVSFKAPAATYDEACKAAEPVLASFTLATTAPISRPRP